LFPLLSLFSFPHSSSLAMGDDESQYLNWLTYHQCRAGFENSYYFISLVSRVEALFKRAPDPSRPVPPSGVCEVIESLLREEEELGQPSKMLGFFLAESLGFALKEDIGPSDAYERLHQWLPSVLNGSKNPLSDQFHKLTSQSKCFILDIIYKTIDATPPAFDLIGKDSNGNSFHAVGGRLYIEQEINKKLSSQKPPSQYSSQKNWKLMADSEIKWRRIANLMQSFGQEEISEKINTKYDEIRHEQKYEATNWDATHLWLHVNYCRKTIAPFKVSPRKCKNDSICNDENCVFNHYEQYHPMTTKFENDHLEYARMRENQVDLEFKKL
ncbi:hypothetical protein PMAYCL1PPCAC_21958, partial [Pristionchus mayeri]